MNCVNAANYYSMQDPDNPCILPFLVQNKLSFLSWFKKNPLAFFEVKILK